MQENEHMANNDEMRTYNTLISSTSLQLAQWMKKYPEKIDKQLVTEGEKYVEIFESEKLRIQKSNQYTEMKINLIMQAIDDISVGANRLRVSTFGLVEQDFNILPYELSIGQIPKGMIMYCLTWKNVESILALKNKKVKEISQEEINSSIYFLTTQLSKLV